MRAFPRRFFIMKHSIPGFLFSVLAIALTCTAAAMNNKDVIKMQKAGLSEETILAAMQKEKPEYDTDTDALIELKTAGVSEKLIQTMLKLQTAGSSSRRDALPQGNAAPAVSPSVSAPSAPFATSGSGGAFSQEFPSIAPPKVEMVTGQDYFTRYTFHEEKNQHITTNYSRGSIVPINTPVKLISMSGSKMVLKRLDTGQEIKVENEDKYTKKSVPEVAALMLSAEKTPLEKLPEPVAASVRSGEMRKGMTKELVLMARGYPPAHETPSLEGDRWVYWSSRFVKQTIVFADGRLSEGRNIY
jgi:hypothetical protein